MLQTKFYPSLDYLTMRSDGKFASKFAVTVPKGSLELGTKPEKELLDYPKAATTNISGNDSYKMY